LDAQTLHILKQTVQHFDDNHRQAYLVGGSLRNLLLSEPVIDWDIVTDGDAPHLARRLADKLGGHYAHMNEKASRVVIKQDTGEIILDVSPLNGNTIEDDLRRRDFTIDAMAAPLSDIVQLISRGGSGWDEGMGPLWPPAPGVGIQLIDPTGGLTDIAARRLRAVDDAIFKHDPLRMLRAVRLMMRYGLSIDPETEQLLARDAQLLRGVAAERVHDELYAILELEGASGRLRFLDEHGLFMVIFPEFIPARGMRQPYPHYWDVLEHSIEAVGTLERLAGMLQGEMEQGEGLVGGASSPTPHPQPPPPLLGQGEGLAGGASSPTPHPQPPPPLLEIRTLLREAEEQGIFSFAELTAPRLKLAGLLHDIGKTVTYATDKEGHIHFYHHPQAGVPLAQEIMKRLRASTRDRRFVQQVVAHHMRPGQLGQDVPVTLRATRRYFADMGPTGIYVTLISLADHLATLGPQPAGEAWKRHLGVVRLLLARYIRERESILPPRLISAEELMRRLQLEPGPQVGQLLELIAEAQAEGRIHSKEEAVWLAEDARTIARDGPLDVSSINAEQSEE
jgi:tRNA nucleotidyltransferase/poly(A) polymerase